MGGLSGPGAKSTTLLTTAQLEAALAAAKPGSTVYAAAATYRIKKTLSVPEGVTLQGVGDMSFDIIGRPAGFSGLTTTLVADPALEWDVVTLSKKAVIRGLIVKDVPRTAPPSQRGNLVVVSSSAPGDEVDASATIEACELHNPNPSGRGLNGPTGCGLLVFSRNDEAASGSLPHEGSTVLATMVRSIVGTAPGGTGVFAVNFAANSRVAVRLQRNIIGGGLDIVGGVSRPDPVFNSETYIESERNLYRAHAPAGIGWFLHGASNPPPVDFKPAFTDFNKLVMKSDSDVIEGFKVGVYAAAGWRPHSGGGEVNGNYAEVELTDTVFVKSAAADVMLFGAEAGKPPAGSPAFSPGDYNHLKVILKNVTASTGGPLNNVYEDCAFSGGGLLPLGLRGTGNQFEIVGKVPFNIGPPP